MLGSIFVLFGVLSSIIVGKILDKTQRYLFSLRAVCVATVVMFCIGFISFKSENIYIVSVNTALNGMALVPFFPVCIGFAAELTFPLQEAVIVGSLLMMG